MQKLFFLLFLLAIKAVACLGCGGVLSDMYGQFQSPNHPDYYPVETSCKWIICVPKGYRIRLEFVRFELEEHSAECDYDRVNVSSPNGSLQVYRSQNMCQSPISTETFMLFCGTPDTDGPKGPILSDGNYAIVTLYSDHSETGPGFLAHYAAIDIDECMDSEVCHHFCHNYIGGYCCSCKRGYNLAADKKTCYFKCQNNVINVGSDECRELESPEYPENYPSHSNCDWTINVPTGNQMEIQINEMDIEEHHNVYCPYDKLMICLGEDRDVTYCGKSLPNPISSLSNQIKIQFISDENLNLKGFKLTYCAKRLVCGDPGVPQNGTRIGSNWKYGDRVQFRCDNGFRLIGASSVQCMASGRWSANRPTCKRKSCGNPGHPAHGKTVIKEGIEKNYVYQDVIKSTCDPFYEWASGDDTRLCKVDGVWAGNPLKCKPSCGERTFYSRGQIVGGRAAVHGEYPWMALLYDNPCQRDPRLCAFCGGAIINEKFVVTAAHCLTPQNKNKFIVRLGVHNHRRGGLQELKCQPKRVIIHPNYDKNTFGADVAIIELDNCTSTKTGNIRMSEIEMSKYVRPICLPSAPDAQLQAEGSWTIAAGWGVKLSEKETSAIVLQRARLKVANTRQCQTHFRPQDYLVKPDMFCTIGGKGRDTCRGDSGGPLFARRGNQKFVMLGIVSWGDDLCGSGYSVYANALHYVAWIKQTVSYV